MNNMKDKELQNSLRKEKTFRESPSTVISSHYSDAYNEVLESPQYALAYKKINERIIPNFNIREPKTFAKYGSAKKYYEDAFLYIHSQYPYDGSALERINWSLSASAVDLSILQNEYPIKTGYVTFSPSAWGPVETPGARYSEPVTKEYIKFSGGPYVGTVLDATTKRESSLKIDPSSGNTLEFWLKKPSFVSSLTPSEVVFDSYTIDFEEGNSKYGRFLLELSSTGNGSPFYLTYMSGTTGLDRVQIGSEITAASVADDKFHHYAFSVKHISDNDQIKVDFYVDGEYNSTYIKDAVQSFNSVLGYFNGTIGSLATTKDTFGGLGYGKLSGSLDEVRFWKTARNAQEIGNFYDYPVFGATDQESISSDLGLYYKFNEGIFGNDSNDKIVLDYSGRINNGEFIGYSSENRSEDSAITLSTKTSEKEPGDPVINPFNPDVISALDILKNIASPYDTQNAGSIFNSLPNWTLASDPRKEHLNNDFSILMQTVAQKFDSMWLIINEVPKIGFTEYRDFIYAKTTSDHRSNFPCILGCDNEFRQDINSLSSLDNFSIQNLMGKGFTIEEMPFVDKATLNEYFKNIRLQQYDSSSNRFSHLIYSKVDALKDKVLNSVYNNLSNIYKTKGTIQSFRNVIRCFGIDEKLLAPNIYGKNTEKDISQNNKKVIDTVSLRSLSLSSENRNATLLQTSSNSVERNYIEGSSNPELYTLEGNFIFPTVNNENVHLISNTSSVFGMNEVDAVTGTSVAANNCGIIVETIRSSTLNKGSYFRLKSKNNIFSDIKTNYFSEVFDNTRWFLAVKFSKKSDLKFSKANSASDTDYIVSFSGYRYEADILLQNFLHTASISAADYQNFYSSNKNVFAGAARQNISGSVETFSNARVISLRFWNDCLNEEELKSHASNIEDISREYPFSSKELSEFDNALTSDSLVFNWQFDSAAEADNYNIIIEDAASGSLNKISNFGNVLGYKYPAKTIGASSEFILDSEHLISLRDTEVDNLFSESMVEIKEREIETFLLSSRPITYKFSYEKSMYQVISREMLNMIGGSIAFNKMIGEPIHKYRHNYKSLEKVRERFFKNIENEISFEKFVEYFKWFDSSLGKMLQNLQPATSEMNLGIQDVVESHALERSKYSHQAPQFEFKDPNLEGQILAINELLYDWEHGHAPLSLEEADNCLWWQDRAERDGELSILNAPNGNREKLRKFRNTVVSGSTYVLRKLSRPYKITSDRQRLYNIGSNRNANKNKDLYKIINSGKEIRIEKEDIFEFKQCNDVINPQKEKLYTAKTNTTTTDGYLDADADMILPFSLYSSSAGTDFSNFKEKLSVTNIHDTQIGVLQSQKFKEIYSMPHRSVRIGTEFSDRPEAFQISASASRLTLKLPDGPKSMFSKGTMSNYFIGNIKNKLEADPIIIGNYDKDYEIVQTHGRHLNNRYLTRSGSFDDTGTSSDYVSGIVDYRVIDRGRSEHIFVNKFSSLGGSEVASEQARDLETGEYSIYNTVNYRNSLVRSIYDLLSQEFSEKFGYRSGSTSQASIHMTNRNYFHTTGSEGKIKKEDNFFVQHPIPQNDLSYSWLTASAVTEKYDFVNANDGFGHQHLFNTSSKESIAFVTSSQRSETFSFSRDNFSIIDEFVTSSNFATSSQSTYHLNDLLLNRHGPYGWPTWKQIRNSQNPIVINLARTNTFSRIFLAEEQDENYSKSKLTPNMNILMNKEILRHGSARHYTDPYAANAKLEKLNRPITSDYRRVIRNYNENPLTDRFRSATMTIHTYPAPNPDGPGLDSEAALLEFGLSVDPRQARFFEQLDTQPMLIQVLREQRWYKDALYYESRDETPAGVDLSYAINELEQIPGAISDPEGYFGNVSIRHTFQNDITMFANQNLQQDIMLEDNLMNSSFFSFVYGITDVNKEEDRLVEINYLEKLYPKEVHTFSKKARERETFDYFPWKSSVELRSNILSGNIEYHNSDPLLSVAGVRAFPTRSFADPEDYKSSYFGKYDAVDVTKVGSIAGTATLQRISGSTWLLDSRKDFSAPPTDIKVSFLNDGLFPFTRDQGTRFEGILQNDFSTYPLGYNGLYGTPPFSMVYNRRIPQDHNDKSFLAGEAKWIAADNSMGPFFDSYKDYSFETIKLVGQNHSIVSEFRISEFMEDILEGKRPYPNIGDDYLSLTGAIHQNPEGQVELAGKFFDTYSNSDFLKYFSHYDEQVEGLGYSHTRLNFKCTAAMRFLPYKGFYPAERTLELARLFNKYYLSDEVLNSATFRDDSPIDDDALKEYLKLRANASSYQSSKSFFGPGVLYNSIKSGVAVDYPIFSTDFTDVYQNMDDTELMKRFSDLSVDSNSSFTGSIINSTMDAGIPRIKSNTTHRVSFEDFLNPSELYGINIYDNEPHPSASLIYGNDHWHKIIERPASFGRFQLDDLVRRMGIVHQNTKEGFAKQMAPFTLAAQNFAAETVNFFVDQGLLTTAISEPINEHFEKDTTHKMRVYIVNRDTMMYDRHSAFGPAVDDGSNEVDYTLNSATGTEEEFTITFQDPAGFSLASITLENDLPKITITDAFSVSHDFNFHDSTAITPITSDDKSFIDVSGKSDIQLAEAFKTSVENSGLALLVSQASSAITVSLAAKGPSSANSIQLTNGNLGSPAQISVNSTQGPDNNITNNSSFSFTGAAPAASAEVELEFNGATSHTPSLSGITNQADLPKISITDHDGDQKHFKFYDATAISSPTPETNTIFVSVGSSNSDTTVASSFKSAVNSAGLALTASVDAAKVKLILNHIGSSTTADITTNSVEPIILGDVLSNTSLAWSGGTDATAASESIEFDDPSSYYSELEKIIDINDLPSLTITDHLSASRIYKFHASTRSYTPPSGTILISINSSDTASQLASELKTKLEADIGNGDISLANVSVSTDTIVFELATSGVQPSADITVSDGIVPGVIEMGGHIIIEADPDFSTGISPPAENFIENEDTSGISHGYMPYVPPFLDADSEPYVEITFSPTETKRYTAQEIIEKSVFNYYNFKEPPTNPNTNTNYKYSMSLSASLNLGMTVTLNTDNETYDYLPDPDTGLLTVTNRQILSSDARFQSAKLSRWVIQTKWETPVLDFKDNKVPALNLSSMSVSDVQGSPWKERYWNRYYTKVKPTSNQSIGDFLTSSTGMWHQSGSIIDREEISNVQKEKGYFLSIQDVETDNSSGLATKLGFLKLTPEQQFHEKHSGLETTFEFNKRIGPVEDEKLVKEAIVAIPYVPSNVPGEDALELNFVEFDQRYYRMAVESRERRIRDLNTKLLSNQVSSIEDYKAEMRGYDAFAKSPMSDAPINSIEYQLNMMDEFVLPPQLDFRITGKTPYSMYFFQFNASLNKEDIARVWQNMYPTSPESTGSPRYSYPTYRLRDRNNGSVFDTSYVGHYLDTLNLNGLNLSPVLNPKDLLLGDTDYNTRWLVFKVKQRAVDSLEVIRLKSIDQRLANIERGEINYVKASKPSSIDKNSLKDLPGFQTGQDEHLRFNWPYDYFSFVELIKLEAKIDSFNDRD